MFVFIKLIFTAFAQTITSIFYVLLIALVYANIKKSAQLEEVWLGFLRNAASDQLMDVVFYGRHSEGPSRLNCGSS